MKKMFFAVAAAFVMVSVSNVFANSNVQLGNAGMAQVNDTVDTTVVAPAIPADSTAAPSDSIAQPVGPVTPEASMAVVPTAPADTVVTPVTPEEPATPATPAVPADSTAKPAVDSTSVAQ